MSIRRHLDLCEHLAAGETHPWPRALGPRFADALRSSLSQRLHGRTTRDRSRGRIRTGEDKMVPTIESTIRSDIGGDEQRIHGYTTNHSNITFKLFFLPLWLSSFRYDTKVFRFVVNARTGEAVGERPYSVTQDRARRARRARVDRCDRRDRSAHEIARKTERPRASPRSNGQGKVPQNACRCT